jgi:hypothetical protein
VCDRCLKYMVDSATWEVHLVRTSYPSLVGNRYDAHGIEEQKRCEMKRPPGKKVYENGAQRIFEVDGSKEKVIRFSYQGEVLDAQIAVAAILPKPIALWEAVH